jgi:hypothetical protein
VAFQDTCFALPRRIQRLAMPLVRLQNRGGLALTNGSRRLCCQALTSRFPPRTHWYCYHLSVRGTAIAPNIGLGFDQRASSDFSYRHSQSSNFISRTPPAQMMNNPELGATVETKHDISILFLGSHYWRPNPNSGVCLRLGPA